MLNVSFDTYLFLRTPTISYQEYTVDKLAVILKTSFFKTAIFFASESLYLELNRHEFNYHLLDNKLKFSLQKYFNRMCYRPTPFGMFSAFSSISWNSGNDSKACILSDEKQVYVNPDFQFSVDIGRKMESSGAYKNVKYYSNTAIYSMISEKRYLTSLIDSEQQKTDFIIASYRADRLLNKLLVFCKNGKTKVELLTWLAGFIDDADEIRTYAADLIKAGLLITELSPNLSGEKYFTRLVNISRANKSGELTKELLKFEHMINSIKNENDVNIKVIEENKLRRLSDKTLKSMYYVGCEKTSQSLLDKRYQGYILEGLHCLDIITADTAPKSLVAFKNKFKTRFEDQEVPILQALDREAGVGYEGLEANLVTSQLLEGIQLDPRLNTVNFSWTAVHEFFLTGLLKLKTDDHISISDKDLEKLPAQSDLKTPPSFSVVFRLAGDKVWLEQAGGCTGTSLLGRFTLFSKGVCDETRRIAAAEEKLNDKVIFAEISCFNDEHAANINSNAGIRSYEIPIGVYSTLNRSHIIALSDIMVSVENDSIVLRSKKLNKVIIPRLSSAFNYNRSELSIFRFLCDMQFQGLKFHYNFDLRSLLPGLSFYPRVEYKNCILFPSVWILSADDIAEIFNGESAESNFDSVVKRIRLKKHFALAEGDNQLLFDRDDAASVGVLINILKNKISAVLQEVFFDQAVSVQDTAGQPFIGQFVGTVLSADVAYPQKSLLPVSRQKKRVKRIYLPGDEWIYFKLYCHPAASNHILTNQVRTIIARLKKQTILKKWFFVRYNDPDHHLRVRIQINKKDTGAVVNHFDKKMRLHVEKGSVNNLLLDTYKREIERYGADTIEFAENVFQASSELIICYLKNMGKWPAGYSELHLAMISAHTILETFFSQDYDRLFLLKSMHKSMKHEFMDNKQVKFQLDNKYRELTHFINNMQNYKAAIIKITGKKEFAAHIGALILLRDIILAAAPGKIMKFTGDLIHMHLNRLFNEKQRNHEFVIYYLLQKYYVSLAARKEKVSSSSSKAPEGHTVNYMSEVFFK